MSVSRKGKAARTRYQVERRFTEPAPATLLEVVLETGRTHQIRVHCSAIGHPVVGDDTYSRGRSLPGTTLVRPFLHAWSLSFDHPVSGDRMEWSSPLPDDLDTELARLSQGS
jgi:23S rRNA pseudouridine1911/1915/1917 synthase